MRQPSDAPFLASLVLRWPALVIVAILLLTGGFGYFSTQGTTVDANTFDNETTEVLDLLDAEFGDQQAVLQLIVTAEDGIRGGAALEAAIDIKQAVLTGAQSGSLADPQGNQPIIAYSDGVEMAADNAGIEPDSLTDDELAALYDTAAEQAPAEIQRLLDSLIADQQQPESGLILVFQDTTGLDSDQVTAAQRDMGDLVAALDLPAGVTVEPFSLELLINDQDIGAEVGQLFGTALLGIMIVLAIVYWVRPQAGARWLVTRRTLADVAITLGVIVMSVIWMRGIGTLLGPGYADLIGPFSPQTDVVPILLVGLGVDFGVHMLARYRDELGAGHSPNTAYRTSAATIGVTLAVATVATAIGFLTNLTSPVEFIQTLGALAAIGVTSAFLITLTFLAAIRILLDRRAERGNKLPAASLAGQSQQRLPRAAQRAVWFAQRAPLRVLAAALLLTAAGAYGFTQLDARFDRTDFVPQNAPQLATLQQLEEQFGGGLEESTQVLLRGDLSTPEAQSALEESLSRAEQIDAVDAVRGEPEINDEGSIGRVDLLTNARLSGALDLSDDLIAAFAPLRDIGVETVPASIEKAQAELTEQISGTQARSLTIALAAATLLLIGFYWRTERRPLLGIVALMPAAIVLSWTFGTMALTGIPLNPVTATLTALSIGIAVPFTVYIVSRFLEERRHHEAIEALRRTLRRTGGPLAGSTVTTAIGFGILITSSLLPFKQLGYIIVYVLIFSMIVSLFVLPSLLVLWDRWNNHAPSRHVSAPKPKE
ncbi:efflux RND transporter permease subunit [Natronoglycomyces albus]|uniref:MMPL family transporter n=1 Tax=Natronoglycomyces albus TaxID=2811108 RepID=A0A895XS97_9ACTN|nr:MMPL family transporter [Natronoglycomyces albus]QSB04508.1 MMPL family transporter [Natronoglycomyces albus]